MHIHKIVYIKTFKIQQTVQKCNRLVDKQAHKYLINIKPAAPKLNIYIKTHKNNEPIRPVINNTQAPSYKVAKYLNKKWSDFKCFNINNFMYVH